MIKINHLLVKMEQEQSVNPNADNEGGGGGGYDLVTVKGQPIKFQIACKVLRVET
jgi:hypothetical protein